MAMACDNQQRAKMAEWPCVALSGVTVNRVLVGEGARRASSFKRAWRRNMQKKRARAVLTYCNANNLDGNVPIRTIGASMILQSRDRNHGVKRREEDGVSMLVF